MYFTVLSLHHFSTLHVSIHAYFYYCYHFYGFKRFEQKDLYQSRVCSVQNWCRKQQGSFLMLHKPGGCYLQIGGKYYRHTCIHTHTHISTSNAKYKLWSWFLERGFKVDLDDMKWKGCRNSWHKSFLCVHLCKSLIFYWLITSLRNKFWH